ncbi:glycerate 2-kinase [Enterococcus sp. DIV0724b]|uniref:glycerate kinase n=1 Tax=Enterococcus sp. DIV0724b TaxID=2774694 RepID=UPI003D2FEEDE
MKILTAIDSMKGSLSSIEANQIIADIFTKEGHQVQQVAIADGGEGTVDAVVKNNNGQKIAAHVQALDGKKIIAHFGWFETEKLAVIESAAASGIQFLNGTVMTHPKNTSSYGTGQLILAAIDHGAQTIIIGLGGTGTVDGGIGLLNALGIEFYDKNQQKLSAKGSNLANIHSFSKKRLDPRIAKINFQIAADVKSPLTGATGAVKMFGQQKGISQSELTDYELAMKYYQRLLIKEEQSVPGDGAAGGLGFAIRTFLHGTSRSGLEFISEQTDLENLIQQVDLVVTGEGKMDKQSLQGKVPVGIGRIAKKYGVPVIAFAGTFSGDEAQFQEEGISVIIPIIDQITTLEEAMNGARENLRRTSKRTIRLVTLFN